MVERKQRRARKARKPLPANVVDLHQFGLRKRFDESLEKLPVDLVNAALARHPSLAAQRGGVSLFCDSARQIGAGTADVDEAYELAAALADSFRALRDLRRLVADKGTAGVVRGRGLGLIWKRLRKPRDDA